MKTPETLFDFTTQLDGISFHFRASQKDVPEHETVNQTPHLHYAWEMHYIYDGSITLHTADADDPIVIKQGGCCLIPEKLVHALHSDNVTRFCFKLKFEFDTSLRENKLDNYLKLQNTLHNIRGVKLFQDAHISSLMEQFKSIADSPHRFAQYQKGFLLMGVFLRACQLAEGDFYTRRSAVNASKSLSNSERKWIIEEHIAGDYSSEKDISSLAKKLFLGERQTRVLVQKIMGENYKTLIIKHRMEVAHLLLTTSTATLGEIATQVGYRSYNGFYSAYVNYFGVSPEEARVQAQLAHADIDPLSQKVEAELK